MSNNYFTPYTDDTSEFSATSMNKPLAAFDQALSYLKNIIITVDGGIQTNSITGAFSFTGKMRFLFTNPNSGVLAENLAGSTKIMMALGDCLYVDLNNSTGTEITLSKKNLTAGSNFILPTNRVLVAYRNIVSGEIYLTNTLHKIVIGGGGQSAEQSVTLADGVTVTEGQILCLTSSGKYALADNAQVETTMDLVMVKSAGSGEATVVETGMFTLQSPAAPIGSPLYLGTAGNYTQTAPTESGKIVKCVGYVVADKAVKFKPDSLGIKLA